MRILGGHRSHSFILISQWSHRFMANRRGKSGSSDRLYFLGLETLWTLTVAIKLKDVLLERKAMTNLDSILKSRDNALLTKVCIVKALVFPEVMYGCESLDHKEGWELKNWCFQTVVLEKTLKSPLDSKEVKTVNPKGNQSWMFFGRTVGEAEAPLLWPPDGKSQLIGKDPDAEKDWRQEEKRMTEDEVVG